MFLLPFGQFGHIVSTADKKPKLAPRVNPARYLRTTSPTQYLGLLHPGARKLVRAAEFLPLPKPSSTRPEYKAPMRADQPGHATRQSRYIAEEQITNKASSIAARPEKTPAAGDQSSRAAGQQKTRKPCPSLSRVPPVTTVADQSSHTGIQHPNKTDPPS